MITDLRSRNVIPFDYLVQLSVGSLGSAQVTLVMASDSTFELHQILGQHTDDAATDSAPNHFTVQITDTSTGRQLSNAKIPQRLLVTNTWNKGYLRRPIQFPPSSNVLFDATNLESASDTVTIVLRGFKIFQG